MTSEATASELRKTGISVIGDVRWGTHFCYFYETKQDLLDTLVLYFKAGLEDNEFCLWVVSQLLTVEEARHALGQAVPDLDRHLAKGSLEIHGHDEWYLHNGEYEAERVIQRWREKLNEALARGYPGMRASGDTAWVQKDQWRGFREYEQAFDALSAGQRMIVLCTYPLTTSPAAQIFDVARLHQVAVARRHGTWEMVETPELKQAKAEIKRLNDELEQRVEERTRELAATNEALKRQIIERKEAERQSRVLIDAVPHEIWSGPPDGTLDYCNERWRSYMGLEVEEARRAGWQTMLHPDDRERVLKAWHESVVNGTPYEQEQRHRGADGMYRWFLSRGVPLRDAEGRIVRWYGTNTDIEDRKRTEEQLERSTHLLQTFSRRLFEVQEEERRHLARELHDEIGQSLTAAKITLQSVTGNGGNATVARVQETTAILDRLLGQVRQISLDLRPSMLDDLGLVPALRSLIDQQGRRASVEMRLSAENVPESLDAKVQTTCFRIAQEAITNALRHAHATRVEVDLRRDDENLRLVIRDNGTGFDVESAQAQAVGLGLIGIKERAALLGGRVRIISSPNKGTSIEVSLPLTFSPESQGQQIGT